MMTTTGSPTPQTTLPLFDDECSWYGTDMARRRDWIHELTAAELAELDAAVNAALARNQDMVSMTQREFPLPLLAQRLKNIRRDVLHGRGFVLIRGWPSIQRSMAQNAMAFMGLGTHLGEPVSQNAKGHVLGHVANLGLDFKDPLSRGYQTNSDLSFHTDAGDIVGLLCIRPSREGGLSRIASSTTVWNEMVKRRPDLAEALRTPYAHSRSGEIGEGQKRYFMLAPFQPHEGRMIVALIPAFIRKARAFEEVPPLTKMQTEALKLVDALASDPEIRLDMDFRPGDMQFLCNHSTLHSRTSYEDWPEVERRRHLLRLWLSSDDGPGLPDNITSEFQGRTTSGRPNGVRVPGVPLNAPLDPV